MNVGQIMRFLLRLFCINGTNGSGNKKAIRENANDSFHEENWRQFSLA